MAALRDACHASRTASKERPSAGLAFVKLDFLIGTKWGGKTGKKQERPSRSPTDSGSGSKSKENKDFTSKPLFLKDLAGESRQSLDSKRPVIGGDTPVTNRQTHQEPENPKNSFPPIHHQEIYFRTNKRRTENWRADKPASCFVPMFLVTSCRGMHFFEGRGPAERQVTCRKRIPMQGWPSGGS